MTRRHAEAARRLAWKWRKGIEAATAAEWALRKGLEAKSKEFIRKARRFTRRFSPYLSTYLRERMIRARLNHRESRAKATA